MRGTEELRKGNYFTLEELSNVERSGVEAGGVKWRHDWREVPMRGRSLCEPSVFPVLGARKSVLPQNPVMAAVGALVGGDIAVIVAYFVIVIGVGLWSSVRSKRHSMSGYFLASRQMHFIPVGASLFASNIGSGHFVGLAGAAAANGIAISAFEINAMFVLILLGWVFVPVYMSSGVFTMPEYLRKRFGRQRIRVYLSVLAIILYVFTKISADLFAGAIFLEESMKLDMYSAAIALLVLAGFFTIGGGLTAVIWMDSVQTVIIVIGCFILTIKTFIRVGGYQTLVEDYFDAYANVSMVDNYTRKICNAPPDYAMHIFRDPSPGAADIPWTGLIFGVTVSAVWYWCSDLVIVQRALAAKDTIYAKSGCIFAAYLKFLPLFLLVFPGMAARVIFPDEIGCSVPRLCEEYCGSESGCFNRAYPKLVVEVMPDGLRGLMLSVILASLMNCLTSTFNSSSTIFSIDIYRRFRKNATDMELLVAGRCFVVGLVALSIAWLPIIQTFKWSGLFDYIQSITSFLSPPICAVNVLGLLWERVNEAGAFWGLMCGLIVGLIRFALEFGFPPPTCGNPDTRPEVIQRMVGDFHYLHFGFFLFLFVCLVTTVISLLTKPIDRSHLPRLTFGTRFSRRVRIDLDELDADPEEEERQRQKEKERLRERADTGTPPLWKRAIDCVCGLDAPDAEEEAMEETQHKMSKEEEASKAADFLYEPPFWRRLANINAVICMTFGVFVFTFYA